MLAEAVHSPLWAWGVVPYVCYVTGFLVPVAVWEAIIAQPFARSSLIGYGKAGRRADALACHGGDHGNDRTALGPACCQARQQAASAEGRAGTAETCEAGWTPCAWRPQDRLAGL